LADTGLWEKDPSFGGTGVSPGPRKLNIVKSPLSYPRGIKIPPAPLFQRGGQSPPWEKGDLGGFEVGAAKHTATSHDLFKTTQYEAELKDLCAQVFRATGVKLALEGVYRWIFFMPSKQDPQRPVATRYFGVFADGALKVRGLMCRRRDTPPFVRRAQEALLAKMAQAATPGELAAMRPELEEMAEGFRQRLREGGINPQDLVITRVLSQPVADYKVDTPTALAARQLTAAGIPIRPGEKVRYVLTEGIRGPKECRVAAAPFLETLDSYDAKFYLDLLERAVAEVMIAISYYSGHKIVLISRPEGPENALSDLLA